MNVFLDSDRHKYLLSPAELHHPATRRAMLVIQNAGAWQHIAEKHIRNEAELWKEVLSPSVHAQLRLDSNNTHALSEAASQVWPSGVESLCKPLVLRHISTAGGKEVLCAICRNGLQMIFKANKANAYLATAYFSRSACETANPQRRWRFVVRRIIERWRGNGADGSIAPPTSPVMKFATEGYPIKILVEFVSEENWGFRINSRGQKCWRPNWNLWGDAQPPARYKQRLVPRPYARGGLE